MKVVSLFILLLLTGAIAKVEFHPLSSRSPIKRPLVKGHPSPHSAILLPKGHSSEHIKSSKTANSVVKSKLPPQTRSVQGQSKTKSVTKVSPSVKAFATHIKTTSTAKNGKFRGKGKWGHPRYVYNTIRYISDLFATYLSNTPAFNSKKIGN
ncbi:hypothetical protein BCR33DRAFT_740895 [Rhizoclosmatium globosum]|uniref:Uncharacterized protein n=1 Tax=Rhizoclosmatium globosum TaxID=329046 RepID=A0A1Y2BXV8_9FUNG|nr:hypothetical protein BCR33DRAFT_740895 [Rhizoclosmatium globosum]|eukprot:ORY39576.1 hypothetical protein BCR33DRAFT_740895 [Rhizoclosmatium globosum]